MQYPQGGSSRVTYKQTPLYATAGTSTPLNRRLPFTIDTVEAIAHQDGHGNVATTTYAYGGGEFTNSLDRRFAGFASTTKTDPLGNVTKTYYHQGNGSQGGLGEYSDHVSKIGKPYRIEQYDASGNLYDLTVNRWDRYAINTTSSFVKLATSTVLIYDGMAITKTRPLSTPMTTTMATSRKKIEWGEVTASTDGSFSDTCTDRRTTDILYVASTTEGMGGSLDDLTLPDGFVLSEEGATTSPVDTAGDIAPADEVEGTEESSTTPSIDVGQGSTTPLTTDAASNTPPSIDETTATTTLQDDASSTATDLLETLLEEEFDSLQEPIDPTLPESAIKMMKLKTATPTPSMTELWEQAQKAEHVPTRLQFMREACAVATQAAPYIHARITSVNASTRKVTSIKDLSDEELLALAASAGAEESEEVVGEGAELVH